MRAGVWGYNKEDYSTNISKNPVGVSALAQLEQAGAEPVVKKSESRGNQDPVPGSARRPQYHRPCILGEKGPRSSP